MNVFICRITIASYLFLDVVSVRFQIKKEESVMFYFLAILGIQKGQMYNLIL